MPAYVRQSSGYAAHFLGQANLLAIRIAGFVIHTLMDILTAAIARPFAVLYALVLEKVVSVISGILPSFILTTCSISYQRLFRRTIPKVKLETEIRKRSEDETLERRNAVLAADHVLKTTGRFKLKYPDDPAMDLGSRMQKYWMVVEPGDQWPSLVLTVAPISRHCPLLEDDEQTGERTLKKETVNTLNELIGILQVHPYIHPLVNMNIGQPVWVYYLSERKQLIMVQDNTRSLKDVIYKEEFIARGKDWSDKYHNKKPKETLWSHYLFSVVRLVVGVILRSFCFTWCLVKVITPLDAVFGALNGMLEFLFGRRCKTPPAISLDKMALYGRQILEAMVFLYKQGFPVLGHVHSGNIFVQDGVCRLGGYENTLLGYRSRFYGMCKDHLEHMDVIMFGHLVFEMCCGYELTTVVPTAQDYQAVRDVEGGEEVEEVLRCIFTKRFPHGIEHIFALPLFQSGMMINPFDEKKIQLNVEMASLLARVRGADHEEDHKSKQPGD